MKAEPSRLKPRNLAADLELLIVVLGLCLYFPNCFVEF